MTTRLIFGLTLMLARCAASHGADQPKPLIHAHAHNDYEHTRPLFDALDHGFCSVEAVIYLVNGQLLVAHDRKDLKPERTLQRLYLDPLKKRAIENGGRIYRNGPTIVLLVDFKTNGEDTWPVLREVLSHYADILTSFEGGKVTTRAVTVILTGGRPEKLVAAEAHRFASLDGKFVDLEARHPVALMPWISEQWTKFFQWKGVDPIPLDERKKLDDYVAQVHQQGKQLRFWGAPDIEPVWRELRRANVDWINSDQLAGLQSFFADDHGQ